LGEGAAAVAQPVHFEAGYEAADVFFEFDYVGDSVGVAAGEMFLEDFQDCGFAGQEGGEDFFREFSGAFFDGFDRGFGEFSLEFGYDRFEGGDFFQDYVFVFVLGVGDQFYVVGEAVGEFARAEEVGFAGCEVVDFGGDEGEEEPGFADESGGVFEAEAVVIEEPGGGGDFAGVAGGEDELAAPAEAVEDLGGVGEVVGGEDEVLEGGGIGGGGGVGVVLVFAVGGEGFGD